jgi:hypothetical protein
MSKLFCRNVKCLKASDYDSVLLQYCPFCGTPFSPISLPGVNAAKPVAQQIAEPKIDDNRLPFWKRKATQARQPIQAEIEEEDDGEPLIIPNVSHDDIKIETGAKQTLGSIIQKGKSGGQIKRTDRQLDGDLKKVLNADLDNLLNLAKQQYGNSPAKQIKASRKNVAKRKK